MPDILQDFPIRATPDQVFQEISTPDGLNRWWTETCTGQPALGASYEMGFGPGHHWRAEVTQCDPGARFELTLRQADADWMNTRVGFELSPTPGGTEVRFHHSGWPDASEHYRISCHCWAMYLRLMRRYLEQGETVPYPDRLDA